MANLVEYFHRLNLAERLGLHKSMKRASQYYGSVMFSVSYVSCLLTPVVIGILQSLSFTYNADAINNYLLNYTLFLCDCLFVVDFYYTANAYYKKHKHGRGSKRIKR